MARRHTLLRGTPCLTGRAPESIRRPPSQDGLLDAMRKVLPREERRARMQFPAFTTGVGLLARLRFHPAMFDRIAQLG
jgi:hypothetical protein